MGHHRPVGQTAFAAQIHGILLRSFFSWNMHIFIYNGTCFWNISSSQYWTIVKIHAGNGLKTGNSIKDSSYVYFSLHKTCPVHLSIVFTHNLQSSDKCATCRRSIFERSSRSRVLSGHITLLPYQDMPPSRVESYTFSALTVFHHIFTAQNYAQSLFQQKCLARRSP